MLLCQVVEKFWIIKTVKYCVLIKSENVWKKKKSGLAFTVLFAFIGSKESWIADLC